MTRVLIDALRSAACYPHPIRDVGIVETHISWVILTGDYAYKVKKPVVFSFVDFSTLDRRRKFCEEEVRLNRRLAPDVYLGVVPIAGTSAAPRVEGEGVPIEYAVKMKQFSSEPEICDLLSEQSAVIIPQLAETVAQFHGQVERADGSMPYGEPALIVERVKECIDEIATHALEPDWQNRLTDIDTWLQKEATLLWETLLRRKRTGHVRECHGDLHLGNVALFQNRVCVFDALEFEPRLRWIDVMSEVAFLVMDLEQHGHRDLAFLFLNQYLERTGDYEGLRVFRFYQVYRALVRAKVAGFRLAQLAKGDVQEKTIKDERNSYIELAHGLVKTASSALFIMHGVSGTGKTTVSTEIVKTVGAVRIRSDIERKRLFADKLKLKLKDSRALDLYGSSMTTATYGRLQKLANMLLQIGYVVVVDATFLYYDQRESFRLLAAERKCPFVIIDVVASSKVIEKRIAHRSREGHDASDATVDIMRQQHETQESLTLAEQRFVTTMDSTNSHTIQVGIEILKKHVRY